MSVRDSSAKVINHDNERRELSEERFASESHDTINTKPLYSFHLILLLEIKQDVYITRGRVHLISLRKQPNEMLLPLHVIVVFVVGSKSDEGSQTQAIREEDLCCSINPYLRV